MQLLEEMQQISKDRSDINAGIDAPGENRPVLSSSHSATVAVSELPSNGSTKSPKDTDRSNTPLNGNFVSALVKPNVVTYSTVLNALAKKAAQGDSGSLLKSLQLLDAMKSSGQADTQPNVIAYNSVAQALVYRITQGDVVAVRRGLALIEEMRQSQNCKPDTVTYSTIFNACVSVVKNGNPLVVRYCMLLLDKMNADGADDERTSERVNAFGDRLINALVTRIQAGDLWAQEKCTVVFDYLASKAPPTTHTINSFLKSRSHVSYKETSVLLELFDRYHVPMNSFTFYELFRSISLEASRRPKAPVDEAIMQVREVAQMMKESVHVRLHQSHVKVLKSRSGKNGGLLSTALKEMFPLPASTVATTEEVPASTVATTEEVPASTVATTEEVRAEDLLTTEEVRAGDSMTSPEKEA